MSNDQPTDKEIKDAFEWLREMAMSDFNGRHHAEILLFEIANLNEYVTRTKMSTAIMHEKTPIMVII